MQDSMSPTTLPIILANYTVKYNTLEVYFSDIMGTGQTFSHMDKLKQ
jgi:hypothetical protein